MRACRYVSGDFRFRKAYSRSNPRKMVKMWAEKEMRNLARISRAGLRCPAPLAIRDHVLVMELVGTGSMAAPRLKDARLPDELWQALYEEAVLLVRRLYQECHLVHADLSEYNLLVHEVGRLLQSVNSLAADCCTGWLARSLLQ